MKRLYILAASAVLALSAGHAFAQDALKDALVAQETKAWDAWKEGNKAAYGAVMSDNAVLVNYSDVLKGRDEITSYDLDNECTDRKYEILDSEAYSLNGTTAALVYDVSYSQTCEDVPTEVIARITATYSKSGSKWTNVMLNEILLSVVDSGDEDAEDAADDAADDTDDADDMDDSGDAGSDEPKN